MRVIAFQVLLLSNKMRTRSLITFVAAILAIGGCDRSPQTANVKQYYDRLIPLDAEALAEQGLASAYEDLTPVLRQYIADPVPVFDVIDDEKQTYEIRVGSETYRISTPVTDWSEDQSWGQATYVLFKIVNDQMGDQTYKFYAYMGGNDLSGIFLTPDEADALRRVLELKSEWPYIPTQEPPWFGQPH